MQGHWTDTVIAMANRDIARAKDAMQRQLLRPVVRRLNVRPQIVAAMSAPEQYPLDVRERLATMLRRQYGEQARNVMPYLGIAEPQE